MTAPWSSQSQSPSQSPSLSPMASLVSVKNVYQIPNIYPNIDKNPWNNLTRLHVEKRNISSSMPGASDMSSLR